MLVTIGVGIGAFIAGGIFGPKVASAVKSWFSTEEKKVVDQVKAKL